jgi:hypothetical protein
MIVGLVFLSSCINFIMILCCYHHMIGILFWSHHTFMMTWLILNQMVDYVGGPCSSIGWMMDDFC